MFFTSVGGLSCAKAGPVCDVCVCVQLVYASRYMQPPLPFLHPPPTLTSTARVVWWMQVGRGREDPFVSRDDKTVS